MKKFYLIALLLCSVTVMAQVENEGKSELFPNGTEWVYETQEFVDSYTENVAFQKFTVTGETTVEGKLCKVVEKQGPASIIVGSDSNTEYIYEENNKVYWYNYCTKTFSLLYDFDAEKGDSWNIAVCDCSLKIIVDSVNYSMYGDVSKKNIYVHEEVSMAKAGDTKTEGYFSGKIIEGVGLENNFFPEYLYYICANDANIDGASCAGIRCFDNMTEMYNFAGKPCDTVYTVHLGIEEYADFDNDDVIILPNPANDEITMKAVNGMHETVKVQISDISGKCIMSNLNYAFGSKINISNLVNGVYIITIDNGTQVFNKKLVVSK